MIVQNYNAILSLAHLYQSADVVFTVENDAIHNICTRLLAIPKVSFSDINRVIAQQLALSFVPACSGNSKSLIRSHIGEVLSICQFNNYLLIFTDCHCSNCTECFVYLLYFLFFLSVGIKQKCNNAKVIFISRLCYGICYILRC